MSEIEERTVAFKNDMKKDTLHFYLLNNEKDGRLIKDLGSIQFQNGPVKLRGKNGASMLSVLSGYIDRLSKLNEVHEDAYNSKALKYLLLARSELNKRYEDRSKRGVEGTNRK